TVTSSRVASRGNAVPRETSRRGPLYLVIAFVLPFVVTAAVLALVRYGYVGDFALHYLVIAALSLVLGGVAFGAVLRQRGLPPLAGGGGLIVYLVLGYAVLGTFAMFFTILVLGGGI